MIVVLADQLTKFLVYGKELPFISAVQNTGVGFGILKGSNAIIIFLTLIFIGLVLYYYDQIPKNRFVVVFTALLLGGAVGNLIDRIFLGFVRDFIDLAFWPVFNIADSAITVGGIGLIIYLLKKK